MPRRSGFIQLEESTGDTAEEVFSPRESFINNLSHYSHERIHRFIQQFSEHARRPFRLLRRTGYIQLSQTVGDTVGEIDSPRESFISRLIDYSPSILGFLSAALFLFICSVVFYFAFAPAELASNIVFIVPTLLVLLEVGVVVRGLCKCNVSTVMPRYTCISRACALVFVAQVMALPSLFIPGVKGLSIAIPVMFQEGLFFAALALVFIDALVVVLLFVCAYIWWRVWYKYGYLNHRSETAFAHMEEEAYGTPVLLSMPLFKLCGHFVIMIGNRKYELRLDGADHVPVLNSRLLSEEEVESYQSKLGYLFSILGWTRCTEDEVEEHFWAVLQEFGPYHRFRNNCRHFLMDSGLRVMHVLHRDFALERFTSENPFTLIGDYWLNLFVQCLQDFFIFFITCLLGRGWQRLEPYTIQLVAYLMKPHRLSPFSDGLTEEPNSPLEEHRSTSHTWYPYEEEDLKNWFHRSTLDPDFIIIPTGHTLGLRPAPCPISFPGAIPRRSYRRNTILWIVFGGGGLVCCFGALICMIIFLVMFLSMNPDEW